MITKKAGSLALDAIFAVAILSIFIVSTSGLAFLIYKGNSGTKQMIRDVQAIEDHLEELKGEDWNVLDKQGHTFNDDIYCSYRHIPETTVGTERLEVNVVIKKRTFMIPLERDIPVEAPWNNMECCEEMTRFGRRELTIWF